MKFSCTLGTLRAKLDSMEDLFGDKIKAEFVSYNGSVTVRKDDREELRHQAYNYLLRFPNLGFVLRLGDVCWWYEEEQRKELATRRCSGVRMTAGWNTTVRNG